SGSRMRPFASHSKKRTQAVAEEALRDPRPGEWRVRLADGRPAGCLPPALRSPLSPSLSGRNLEAIARRRAQTAADETGQVEREDYEYEREGVRNLCLWCEPLGNRRHVEVTERRTKADWARVVKDLVDVQYPEAERI